MQFCGERITWATGAIMAGYPGTRLTRKDCSSTCPLDDLSDFAGIGTIFVQMEMLLNSKRNK